MVHMVHVVLPFVAVTNDTWSIRPFYIFCTNKSKRNSLKDVHCFINIGNPAPAAHTQPTYHVRDNQLSEIYELYPVDALNHS